MLIWHFGSDGSHLIAVKDTEVRIVVIWVPATVTEKRDTSGEGFTSEEGESFSQDASISPFLKMLLAQTAVSQYNEASNFGALVKRLKFDE